MTTTADQVGRLALRRAIEIRKRLAIPVDHAVCAIDLAQQLDIEVWLKPLASLAGMYSAGDEPVIVLGSDRPAGYQASVCAHEIGHHVFGHGTRVDEYVEGAARARSDDAEEAAANRFSSHLLMPQAAVTRVFSVRGWSLSRPTPKQVYIAAGCLGVGYQALIHHLRWTIQSLAGNVFDQLLKFQAKHIRESLRGQATAENLIVADVQWLDRPLDLVVGDWAFLPVGARVEGSAVQVADETGTHVLVRAVRRGIARADEPRTDWSAFIRVMPKCFDGAAVHRHLEDPDES